MLGTRTKQVFSYGRRGHRIVNVSEDREQLKAPHVEPTMSRRENNPTPSPTPSPQPVKRRRKFVVTSALLSSPESAQKVVRPSTASKRMKKSPKVAKVGKVGVALPARQPLSSIHANLPSSPAAPALLHKKRKSSIAKRSPLKPHSPFVDVDIVVLDAQGRRVSQERRVSRSDVQVNKDPAPPAKARKKPSLVKPSSPIVLSTDSDEDTPVVKRPRKVGTRVRPILISSDESDSEAELNTTVKLPSLAVTVKLAESPETPPRKFGASRQTATIKPIIRKPPSQPPSQQVVPPPTRASRQLPAVVTPPPPKLPAARPQINHPVPKAAAPSPYPGPPPAFLPFKQANFHALTSPALYRTKARQLTPIRGRQNRDIFPAPPSPPSPTTPSDFDLTFDFSQLDLSAVDDAGVTDAHTASAPAYLQPLLIECGQSAPYEFSAFIEMFPFDALVQGAATLARFQKIGEASYSEVFGIGDVVLKVIPLRAEDAVCASGVGTDDVDEPAPSDVKDVLKEVIVTRTMGERCTGFVQLLRTYVVRGRYPSLLLDLWDEYNDKKGSESVRPDTFTVSQAYAIIVLPNGGPDLEAYLFESASKTGWRQACSLFWQITRTLAEAEDSMCFEHRDLHWGQILVKNVPVASDRTSNRKLPMDHAAHGVQATIIDLGLARMDSEDGSDVPKWTPFDEEIFEGEGEYQFDVYRMMKTHNGNLWEAFRPLTNVMWLHYLALKLLYSKRLRPPPASRKSTAVTVPAIFSERECYQCLVEIEAVLAQCVAAYKPIPRPAPRKGRRKTTAPDKASTPAVSAGPKSAADVLSIAIGHGWVS